MFGILSAVIVLLVFLWVFQDLIWQQAPFSNREAGKPDQPVQYNLKVNLVDEPRLAGKKVLFVKWLMRTGIGEFLSYSLLRKINMDQFRQRRLPDAPRLFPLPKSSPKTMTYTPVNFDKLVDVDPEKSIDHAGKDSFKFVTIPDLVRQYRSQTVTPMQIAERVIEIIKDMEKQTPNLKAIVQHSKEEVLKMAAASTKRYAEGKPLSFMDGIPVAVKESYDVVPYRNRSGTTFLGSSPATEDATIVKKLRDGGALIIGISNMHELGISVTGNNPNRLHGTPRNPYDVNHYTGGSSSGSAVAVASGLCPVALGTDGGGSIRIPSSMCGIAGIKASCGRVSSSGLFSLGPTVAGAGPMCATVRDVALVYAYVAGKDEKDPNTLCQPDVTLEGFEEISSLDGITLGIDWKYFKDCDPEVYQECQKAVEHLENRGASVVPISIPELMETVIAHVVTIFSEMATSLNEEFHKYHSELNADSVFNLAMGRSFTSRDYFQAAMQRTRAMSFLKAIFEDGVDCILTPGIGLKVPEIPEDALEYGESDLHKGFQIIRFMGLANFTGIPGMTLPVGYDNRGLPIGLQIMTSWWNEHVMLRVAHAAEGFVTRKRPQVYYSLLE